jgi:predicted DNA-binding transcriptional regulator AlpA
MKDCSERRSDAPCVEVDQVSVIACTYLQKAEMSKKENSQTSYSPDIPQCLAVAWVGPRLDIWRGPGILSWVCLFLVDRPNCRVVVCCAVMARKPRYGSGDRALYYRTAEVASVLRISTRTLFRKLKSGEFPEPKRDPVNNYRVWTISEIEQLGNLMKG